MLRFLRNLLLMEVLIATAVVGIFAAMLLSRVAYYQEMAEKANMELVISSLKSALRMRLASMMIEGRAMRYGDLADDNAMDWLERVPANYGGHLPPSLDREELEGRWFFDPKSKTLVYWVKDGEHFKPDAANQKKVRLRVELRYQNGNPGSKAGEPVVGAQLVLVEPYQWL